MLRLQKGYKNLYFDIRRKGSRPLLLGFQQPQISLLVGPFLIPQTSNSLWLMAVRTDSLLLSFSHDLN